MREEELDGDEKPVSIALPSAIDGVALVDRCLTSVNDRWRCNYVCFQLWFTLSKFTTVE